MNDDALSELVARIKACTVCAASLPLGPRPVLHVSPRARLLIASQAPGTKVHETGISFNDASGDRLRSWLGMDRATFYDAEKVALVPMGFCYPGRLPKGGDCAPRKECAPLWRDQVLANLPDVQLTLLVGSYAQNYVLGPGRVSDRLVHVMDSLPQSFPLPHPSWRTGACVKRNPWFGEEVLPALREHVAKALAC